MTAENALKAGSRLGSPAGRASPARRPAAGVALVVPAAIAVAALTPDHRSLALSSRT
jgi:hypothetical protein